MVDARIPAIIGNRTLQTIIMIILLTYSGTIQRIHFRALYSLYSGNRAGII